MLIREAREADAPGLLELLISLDHETKFMLYEPGERKSTGDDIRLRIKKVSDSGSLLLVAEADGKLVGFVEADRGSANRTNHSCYLVIGILKEYTGQGLGVRLFKAMEEWAQSNQIIRLELTVMTHNAAALRLYNKMGFKIEGRKEKSLKIDGALIDEYYMAKILP